MKGLPVYGSIKAAFIKLVFVLCLLTVSDSEGLAANKMGAPSSADATIKVFRKPIFPACLRDLDVFVNDALIGSVNNGETRSFSFVPRIDGTNAVFAQLAGVKSNVLNFKSRPGHAFSIVSELIPGFWDAELRIEPDGPIESEDVGIEGVRVYLNPGFTRTEVSSETIELPVGVISRTKKARTIERAILIAQREMQEIGLQAEIPVLSAAIRTQIGEETGQTFTQSETIEQEVTLDGNVSQKYKLIWYDRIRTGTVEFRLGGKLRNMPFKFREFAELRVEALKW